MERGACGSESDLGFSVLLAVVLGKSLTLSLRWLMCVRGPMMPVPTGLFWEQMTQYFQNSKG